MPTNEPLIEAPLDIRFKSEESGQVALVEFEVGNLTDDTSPLPILVAKARTARGSGLTPQQESFGGQAVHADARFSGVQCQGTVCLRRDAKGYGTAVAACR